MLQLFRNLIKSRVGAAVAIGVLVLIALAFASGDVANTGGFGGIAGGDRVAQVGDERIDTATLSQSASSALERAKQDDPTLSMKAFLANDGLESVLENLIDRLAIAVFGRENGIVASDSLVDSEIVQISAFRGADGKFSEDIFRQAIQQRGVSEKLIREDLKQGLIARQVMLPASTGALMPLELVKRYTSLLRETRTGEIAVLPTALFEDKEEPSDEELSSYYSKNRDKFIRPERRVIRYASFGEEVLKNVPEATDAEIAFRYNSNKAQYAASEKRRITQTVVPTEAAAKALADEVKMGLTLEKSAQAKGLTATKLEFFSKSQLSSQYSPAIANAVFGAAVGQLARPAKSSLGWHVIRVDEIETKPARTLAEVRDELASVIDEEKRRVALTEKLESIEDTFDEGGNLVEVAESLGIEPQQTEPLTADGNVYAKAGEKAPALLTRLLDTAFAMETDEPQLAEVERGKTFVVFDVTDIAESAPAPLKEIKDDVKTAYKLEKASSAAKKAATEVKAKAVKEGDLQKALSSIEKRMPPVQKLKMTRPQLARIQQQGQQVPPPIAMMFSMAEGTTKVLPAPNDSAWFVVSLKDIEPGKREEDNEDLTGPQRELSNVLGGEYADALGRSIRSQIGVERNSAAIKAVREQLGGGN